MCGNSYEKVSDRTGKIMVFCKYLEKDGSLSHLCLYQKFCADKDRYIGLNQESNCKNHK